MLSVSVDTFPMHKVFMPIAFVAAAIRILYLPLAVLLAFGPLSGVHGARCVLVGAVSVHEVVLPITFILFYANVRASGCNRRRESDLAVTVLDLDSVVGLPIPYV